MLNYLSTQPSMKKDIRNLRTYSKLTQKELAMKADVPISKLSKCERGLLIPNRHFFDSIAKILSVSSRELQQAHSELFKNPLSGEGYVTSISNTSFVLQRRKKIDEKKINEVYERWSGDSIKLNRGELLFINNKSLEQE